MKDSKTIYESFSFGLQRNLPYIPGSYIAFRRMPSLETGKTKVWSVQEGVTENRGSLGYIKWFGRWRKYAFQPNPNTTFEEVCLREIAEFGAKATHFHRLLNAQAKARAKHGDGPIDLWPKDLLTGPVEFYRSEPNGTQKRFKADMVDGELTNVVQI